MNQQQKIICGINNCSFKTTNKSVMDIHVKGLHSTNTNFTNKWNNTLKFKEATFKVNEVPIQKQFETKTVNFYNSKFSCHECGFTTNWHGVLDDHKTKTHTNKMNLSFVLNK